MAIPIAESAYIAVAASTQQLQAIKRMFTNTNLMAEAPSILKTDNQAALLMFGQAIRFFLKLFRPEAQSDRPSDQTH